MTNFCQCDDHFAPAVAAQSLLCSPQIAPEKKAKRDRFGTSVQLFEKLCTKQKRKSHAAETASGIHRKTK